MAALDGATPVGLAIGSFSSISLEPPLVGFFSDKTSTTFPRIREASAFSINVLAEDQEDVCRAFSVKGRDKFANVAWQPRGARGLPCITSALAWIGCALFEVHEVGDHHLAIGRVEDLLVLREGGPLLYFRGRFGRIGV